MIKNREVAYILIELESNLVRVKCCYQQNDMESITNAINYLINKEDIKQSCNSFRVQDKS